ncbi:MAG: DNA-binding protein [Mycobacterium sp.]|nr:MAG: DNA-binding protein [Mycobacterium sp.]
MWDEQRTADETGIPVGALRQDRHRGTGLPYVRIGRRVRYRPADVAAFLDQHTVTSGAVP